MDRVLAADDMIQKRKATRAEVIAAQLAYAQARCASAGDEEQQQPSL
jgi:hypothetical protein